jgi:hypothetical protein
MGGKGLTLEQDRAINTIAKQEELNKTPRDLDGAGREAYNKNMDEAVAAFREGRYPELSKLDPRASPRNFVDDAVTYEHAVVARNILDAEMKKSDVEAAMRKPYIEEKIREYSIDAGLARGDVAELTKKIPELKKAVDETRAAMKEAEANLKLAKSSPIKDEADAAKVIAAESDYKKAYTNTAAALTAHKVARSELASTIKAIEADSILEVLARNEIPSYTSLTKEYADYKKNVKKAIKELEGVKEKYLAGAHNQPQLVKAESDAELKAMDDQEYEASLKKGFDRAVMDEMDGKGMKIIMEDDDGNLVETTLTGISDEIAADEAAHKIVKGCYL